MHRAWRMPGRSLSRRKEWDQEDIRLLDVVADGLGDDDQVKVTARHLADIRGFLRKAGLWHVESDDPFSL